MAKQVLVEAARGSGTGGSFWAPVAAVITGIAASLCCILPLLAAVGGIGSAALAATFVPYRPWLIGLTALALGYGFYGAFFRSGPVACEDGTCRLPGRVRAQRTMVVIATVVAVAAVSFEWWVRYVLG